MWGSSRYVHHFEQTPIHGVHQWCNLAGQVLNHCSTQCNTILTEVWYVHEAICLKSVGCWLSPLYIHSHFFLVFSTFSFICTLNERHEHQQLCMCRSHWSHKCQSDFVNYTPSRTVSCFFINCIAVNCGTPSSLSNGQRRYSSTTFGYTVTYTCNSGYLRTAGSSSRTCQSNGQWSGSHPTCTRKSALCHFTFRLQTCKRIDCMHNNPFHF